MPVYVGPHEQHPAERFVDQQLRVSGHQPQIGRRWIRGDLPGSDPVAALVEGHGRVVVVMANRMRFPGATADDSSPRSSAHFTVPSVAMWRMPVSATTANPPARREWCAGCRADRAATWDRRKPGRRPPPVRRGYWSGRGSRRRSPAVRRCRPATWSSACATGDRERNQAPGVVGNHDGGAVRHGFDPDLDGELWWSRRRRRCPWALTVPSRDTVSSRPAVSAMIPVWIYVAGRCSPQELAVLVSRRRVRACSGQRRHPRIARSP